MILSLCGIALAYLCEVSLKFPSFLVPLEHWRLTLFLLNGFCWGGDKYWRLRDLRHLDYKTYKMSTKSTPVMDGCSASSKSPAKDNSRVEFDIATYIHASDHSLGDVMKFLLMLGFLTLQGSQPAVAVSDVASGLQSIPYLGDVGDISTGFASAFLLIFFSELGDKTFFIAALLAARNSASVVFVGTFGALAAMTIVSVILGRTFHYVDEILPFRFGETDLPIDDITAVFLLVYFGVSTLLDATSSDGLKAEDEQKEAELAVSKFSGNGAGILSSLNTIVSTFFLVFVAEWGDKSFFSTIALAAASSPLGVIGGALAGHGVATLVICYSFFCKECMPLALEPKY
ncbi:hypothetical protein I3760_11G123900 [Carya illinoinensis]|nr:hypothetical protein I3760_11G123900 [Carya illinoinensis]